MLWPSIWQQQEMRLAQNLDADIFIEAAVENPRRRSRRKLARRTRFWSPPYLSPPFAGPWACSGGAVPARPVGLPPGDFPVSIFDLVLNGHTIHGSIVGMRKGRQQALAFAADGK
jgi:D-arabinose 1-dehydrogenase-like Zn-dependent alcohol dehydrogenase